MIETIAKIVNRNAFKNNTAFFDILSQYNYALIKGEALSFYTYGEIGKRVYGDIDLLLSRKSLHSIEHLLEQFNFKPTVRSRKDKILMLSTSHQAAPWIQEIYPWGHVTIDLNIDIFWGEYTGKRIDIDEFLSDCIKIDIYGAQIKILPPVKTLIHLILHHYKDINSIFLLATCKSIKYDMFKNVYYLLKNNLDSITIDKLYAISSEYEVIPYVYYMLYYTGLLFKDEFLEEYITAFKTTQGEALLNCYGLNKEERHEWKCDFQTRLENDNLYDLIKDDLTEKDLRKIIINKKVF